MVATHAAAAANEREPLVVVEPLGDGRSAATFLLRSGDRELVLRRPPRGPLPPSAHDVLRTREIAAVQRVAGWLRDNLPRSPPPTSVHGDYRLGNVMFAPQAPARVVAVFDWEMATIGDRSPTWATSARCGSSTTIRRSACSSCRVRPV